MATKSLYDIHTNLIESRILLQRALVTCNDGGGNDNNRSNNKNNNDVDGNIEKGLDDLLDKLIDARKMLCQHTLKQQDDSDEDSDDDNSENHKEEEEDDQFERDYNKLQKQWKEVLNRHYDNINITKKYKHDNKRNDSNQGTKFFQTVDLSFWSQVENTVQHNMLLDAQNENDNDNDNNNNNYENPITFDDSKIYQHMLQEYITLSTERDVTNASSMAEHRLRLASKKTNKDKNNVDRRASKGRKIRYVVHEKLKNFTFPLQREVNSKKNHVIMDEDVLFKSMMGGVMSKGSSQR